MIATYLKHPACEGKTIRAATACDPISFFSDFPLLLRVLGNLVKNALEASRVDRVVTLGCRGLSSEKVEFFVHNDGEIPRTAQLQIFNRSFSTKGSGRGLGTYSVKLLTERSAPAGRPQGSQRKSGSRRKTCRLYPAGKK